MTAVDVQRVGEAVSFPGIDPRTWQSLAVVTAVQVTTKGCKVDVELHPSGMLETARVGAILSGVGITMYTPIAVDDEVIVGYPNGNRSAGLVVLARLHSASDPLPQQVVDAPKDVWLVVGEGMNVNIIVADGSKVKLGDSDGTAAVARVGDEVEITQAELTTAGAVAVGAGAVQISQPLRCRIVTGASRVEAK